MDPGASLSEHVDETGTLTLTFRGRLDGPGVATLWDQALARVSSARETGLDLDLAEVAYMDTAGAVLITVVKQAWRRRGGGEPGTLGLSPELEGILALAHEPAAGTGTDRGPDTGDPRPVGALGQALDELLDFVTFVGRITGALGYALAHPGTIRWKDTLLVAEKSGINALPIVSLISFIVGLVMAFQAAIPMKMFGAELFVANLIGIAMVRELGPLMTAIILAGRSGSAFAAEIGTMKINEEIDALTTMGLNPVRFLMVSRVIAAVTVTPMLTLFANLVGILGGSVVLLSMGYPAVSYYRQVLASVDWVDLTGGLAKCLVFGLLIAATGCIRGFQTRTGPSAVGTSATRAVVSGIILIAVFDGIFSVLYYCLGI
jgi:phospholipid/cholesterol/gamma-HCH transport system permease protein